MFLFITVALAWGFTWYAIHLELGPTPDIVSIFWRFAVASGILWLGLAVTRRIEPVPLRQHPRLALLGLTLFSGNFVCLYAAEHNVASGLVAVIFSMAGVFNAINQWCFRGVRPSFRDLLGAFAGVLGVVCLFGNQISTVGQGHYMRGILLALAGTYLFSVGNFVSGRESRAAVNLPNAIARGMSWGVVFLALIVMMRGQSVFPHLTGAYLGGLLYLAVVGSVVGFWAYLSLVARIGATRAAYVTVVSPVIAISVSSVLEHYSWAPLASIGITLIIIGNIIMFSPVGRWWVGATGEGASR
ncbi:MAG: DMT family transporter [Acidocella sp.]